MFNPYGGAYAVRGAGGPSFSAMSLNYWERSLFQRMRTLFDFSGLPTMWDKDAFLFCLYRRGFVVGFESKTYGNVFQEGTPYGVGLNFQPVGMQIASPYFNFNRPLVIGVECAPIKLTPDFVGIWDIIEKYAQELQQMDIAIRQSSINARFAYMFAAKDSKSAQALKTVMEKLANGEQGIVYDVTLKQTMKDGSLTAPWELFDRDLKDNFILPDLLEARRTMLTDFYREIGIRVAPNKKERVNVMETASYDAETFNRRMVWDTCLQESIKIYNEMYGTKISVTFNEPEELRGGEDV